MAYVIRENGQLYCARHDTSYAPTSACGGCVRDPGDPLDADDEAPAAPPKGCMATVDVERTYVAMARDLAGLIAGIRRGKPRKAKRGSKAKVPAAPLDLHAYNTIAKLTDCRIKALRQVHDCAARREDEAVVRRREREKRDLERGATH